MKIISQPDCCQSHCKKCGCGLIFYNDGSGKPLCVCSVCNTSFHFDYEATMGNLNGCGWYLLIAFVLFWIALLITVK